MEIIVKREDSFWNNSTKKFSETTCNSCKSTDVEDSTMPEDGELFPIKHCRPCGNWWGAD